MTEDESLVEFGECKACRLPLPVTEKTLTEHGLLCAECRQPPRGCYVRPGGESLPPMVREALEQHIRACPRSTAFDARRTRTNLDKCTMETENDEEILKEVSVSINTWMGQSLGAIHWYGETHTSVSRIKGGRISWSSTDQDRHKRNGKCTVGERIDAERYVLAMLRHYYGAEWTPEGSRGRSIESRFEETSLDDATICVPYTDTLHLPLKEWDDQDVLDMEVGAPVKLEETAAECVLRAVKCSPEEAIGTVVRIFKVEPQKEENHRYYWYQRWVEILTNGAENAEASLSQPAEDGFGQV